MSNTFYATSGVLSAKFGDVHTDAKFKLGTVACGNGGTEWIYVQSTSAVTQYHCVSIDKDHKIRPITKALADVNPRVGFAQVAFAADEYGWVAMRGSDTNLKVLVKAACADFVDLYTSASAGVLDDTSTSQTKIVGVVTSSSATNSGTQAEAVYAVFPHVA